MQHGGESACPLQRLMVLHLNLAQLCTGRDLGESASLDEWGEQILYYYHQDVETPNNSGQQEAVRFAGLCTALYNLPAALKSYKSGCPEEVANVSSEDQTHEVQLEQSTLVFVPLEDNAYRGESSNNPHILCVAQVSRSRPTSSGGNSLAIRHSIERWHRLFCLLRGGGIHRRLSSAVQVGAQPVITSKIDATKKVEEAAQKSPYPGMKQLFEGRKTLRRLQETIRRSPEPDPDLELEYDNLRKELNRLSRTLPVASLREDLTFHCDAYIGDFTLIASSQGGGGRCIVDSLPAPIALTDGSHAYNWIPKNPPPHVSYFLSQSIRGLLSETTTTGNTQEQQPSRLLAVSTFYRGQLLYHHGIDGKFNEANCSACLLMWYLAFYSFKIEQQQQSQQNFAAATPPRRISHGLVSFSDHMSVTTEADTMDQTNEKGLDKGPGKFLGAPPLAMLSASEQKTTHVFGPQGETVWAPLVHYSSFCGRDSADGGQPETAHVMLYEWKDFSFLLYVTPTDRTQSLEPLDQSHSFHDEDTKNEMAALLGAITKALTDSLNVVLTQTIPIGKSSHQCQTESLKSPGLDIVFIDRSSSQMMLIPRHPRDCLTGHTSASPRRLLDSFRPAALSTPNKQNSSHKMASERSKKAWAAEGMDCRHLLASHLSLDTVLAFDDVMNEVSRYRRQWQEGGQKGGQAKYEVLTTISEGWIYAFGDQHDRELYILLDVKEYVTIADAEKAIKEVRAALLQDSAP